MAHERVETYVNQFAAELRGVPLHQARATITAGQVGALIGTPVTVLESVRVPAGAAVIPVRAAIFKPAGAGAWTVPAGTNFKLRWIGVTTQDLCHLEVDPTTLGAGVGLDQAGEFAAMFSGPSFSLSGFAGVLITKTTTIAAEGRGLQLYSAAGANITGADVPLSLWVWYHQLPVRNA